MQQQQKQQQQKSLTDALNDIIPDVFENLDTQPSIDHELIHSDLFKTAESLISSTIFSMCIDNFASEFNRWVFNIVDGVAVPGCLSGSQFFHPGSEFFPSQSRIRIKEFKYFNPKNCFSALGNMIWVVLPHRDPGSRS
jgi:hypothetical protein